MNGILPINKPKDMTSRDVVNGLVRKLGIKKIGHTGTLDPMAEGVLVLCIGKATKAIEDLQNSDKEYIATMKFGILTDTDDSTGEILKTEDTNIESEELSTVLNEFIGTIDQIPPMYSAKRVEGKRLYELARAGKTVSREPSKVRVSSIDLLEFDFQRQIAKLKINCGKGTYIRSLIRDIASKLDTIATMTALIRTKNANYLLKDCIDYSSIEELKDINNFILSIDSVYDKYRELILPNQHFKHIINGMTVVYNTEQALDEGIYRVYCKSNFIGLGTIFGKDDRGYRLKINKLYY